MAQLPASSLTWSPPNTARPLNLRFSGSSSLFFSTQMARVNWRWTNSLQVPLAKLAVELREAWRGAMTIGLICQCHTTLFVVVGELGWPNIFGGVAWKPMLNHIVSEAVCSRILFGLIGLERK